MGDTDLIRPIPDEGDVNEPSIHEKQKRKTLFLVVN